MADTVGQPLTHASARMSLRSHLRLHPRYIRRVLWIGLPFVLLSAAAMGAFLYLTWPVRAGCIARGVSAAGIDLSGLSPREAAERLGRALPSLERSKVTVRAGANSIERSAAELGAVWNLRPALDDAMGVGRTEGQWPQIEALSTAVWRGRHFPVPVSVRPGLLKAAILPLARGVFEPARNASLNLDETESGVTTAIHVMPEHAGQRLDLSGSARAIASVIAANPTQPAVTISLPIYRILPAVSREKLQQIDGVVSEFTTHYHPWQADRTHNLWLAAESINDTLIMPGQVFSYNHTVGPRLESKGYRAAPIFVEGKVVDDTGGGVCQVATTVYNAALLAACRIIERNHHSMQTSYIRAGRDATVAWDALDLKFKNTRPEPLFLTTSMGDGDLTVKVWGHPHPGEEVQVYTQETGDGVITYRRIRRLDGSETTHVVSSDPYPKPET